ncbi:MAG: M14 family metallopeptidase [Bacteroidales bacterium]
MKSFNYLSHIFWLTMLTFFLFINAWEVNAQDRIPSPEEFFGFQMGADRKLAHWDKTAEYFFLLENKSERLKVINMGPTPEGQPFLIVLITSPGNMKNLDRLQEINHAISDPRGFTDEKIKNYINEGKAVVFQSMGLHSNEVGGTQMTPELAYELLARDDEETRLILENVLFFMIPSLNPDGDIMINEWYSETVGTEYEGMRMPYLYNKYCGHDTNRDADFLNLQESKYTAEAMYVDWPPQAYVDHHQMGSYGARFYVPPYCDPIRPHTDPLVWREIEWYGANMAYKLEEEGHKGVLNDAQFSGWGHFGWHWITPFHNIAGMLTESASVNIATPIYIHPDQLSAGARMFPDYEPQASFPNPWPGGWWHLRDIVKQKKVAAWSLLETTAKNRETVLKNALKKAKNQIKKGEEGDIKALIVPAKQHDELTTTEMINTLMRSGLDIRKAESDFNAGRRQYGEGSYLIPLDQPKRGLILNLLTETRYPQNEWTIKEDGTPLRPYDLATHTMFEFMGVQVDKANEEVEGDFVQLDDFEKPKGEIEQKNSPMVLDGTQNQSFKAVNLLINNGATVKRIDESYKDYRSGDFIVEEVSSVVIEEIADSTGVDFQQLEETTQEKHKVKRGRIGLFQRYYGGNMDEGWTRLCLENFDFPYTSLMSEEIKEGNLRQNYDVIIIPHDSPHHITGFYEETRIDPEDYPEEYRSSIGKEGIKNLREFVDDGGRLVVLGSSYEFAVEQFELDIQNEVKGVSSKEFYCPGSTVKVNFDNSHPFAYGMPDEGVVLFRSSPVFRIPRGRFNHDYQTVVRYQDENLLKSGWLLGEDIIAGMPAMVNARYGDGEVVLIGFRTQHRNQTHGTFKLLFNTVFVSE